MSMQKSKIDNWHSFWALAKTGVIAMIAAAISCGVVSFANNGNSEMTFYPVLIGGILHLVAYIVIGLPFFLLFWPKPHLKIWKWYVALPLGFILGVLPLVVINWVAPAGILIMGGAYGVVTAVAALWVNQRRR